MCLKGENYTVDECHLNETISYCFFPPMYKILDQMSNKIRFHLDNDGDPEKEGLELEGS